jgi:hypothetical protein
LKKQLLDNDETEAKKNPSMYAAQIKCSMHTMRAQEVCLHVGDEQHIIGNIALLKQIDSLDERKLQTEDFV